MPAIGGCDIGRLLGHGAYGETYEATKAGNRVALKLINEEVRVLIERMSRENPTWGVPPIHAELHLLGYEVAESTAAKYRVRIRKPPSQTWKSFLRNHAGQIAE